MERLLLSHARFGDRERFDYSAAYLVERPFNVIAELEALDVPVHNLGGGSVPGAWLVRLIRLVQAERIDVVHVQSPLVAAAVRPVLRSLPHRPQLVYTEHNSWENYRRPTRVLHGATFRMDDVHFAVSEPASSSAPSWIGPRAEVLIHGIDVDTIATQRQQQDEVRAELGIAAGDVLIGIVANFRPSKAYPVLLEAARIVIEHRHHVHFVSVGQGPLAEETQTLATSLGLGDRFRFLGFRDDATRIMAGLDIFTLSSRIEGLPVAVMEAKALGLPIVATSVGGLPQAIRSGTDGLLVPPAHPDLLANALTQLIDSPILMKQLGKASGESAGSYDARVAVRRLESVYRSRTT